MEVVKKLSLALLGGLLAGVGIVIAKEAVATDPFDAAGRVAAILLALSASCACFVYLVRITVDTLPARAAASLTTLRRKRLGDKTGFDNAPLIDERGIRHPHFGWIDWQDIIGIHRHAFDGEYLEGRGLQLCLRDPRHYLGDDALWMRMRFARLSQPEGRYGTVLLLLQPYGIDQYDAYVLALMLRRKHQEPFVEDWTPDMTETEIDEHLREPPVSLPAPSAPPADDYRQRLQALAARAEDRTRLRDRQQDRLQDRRQRSRDAAIWIALGQAAVLALYLAVKYGGN